MGITLSALKTRLQTAVPATNGTPSDAQYEQAVKDAVDDFGRRVPLTRVATLSIVANTGTYNLPADFFKLIRLDRQRATDGIAVTPNGLVPIFPTTERWTIAGRTITLTPTPTYSEARPLTYSALHVLSGSSPNEQYADLTEDGAAVALLKARAEAVRLKAITQAGGFRYSIGDESVDKSMAGKSFFDVADGLERDYERRIAAMRGVAGLRAQYTPEGLPL